MGNQTKLVIAIIVALAGVMLAVRGLLPTRSERTDTPKPRLVTADGSVPEPVRRNSPPPDPADYGWETDENATYEFERVRNDDQAEALAAAIGTRIDADQAGLGASVATFLQPILSKDGDIDAAVTSLGGVGENSGSFKAMLGSLIQHASADPSEIELGVPDEPPTTIGGMSVNRSINRDGDSDPVDLTTLSASFESQFPDAFAEDASGRLAEVKIPMRSAESKADEPDVWLTMQLRYNNAARIWQPAAAQIATTEANVMDRIRTAMTALPQGGG